MSSRSLTPQISLKLSPYLFAYQRGLEASYISVDVRPLCGLDENIGRTDSAVLCAIVVAGRVPHIAMHRCAHVLLVVCLAGAAVGTQPSNDVRDHIASSGGVPVIINTWGGPFQAAAAKAWYVLKKNRSAMDAIEQGCHVCEIEQCDGTVGYGGSPDEKGETTLDAMIMDGVTLNMGAVCALRRVKNAISVARHVLDYTSHSLLAGSQATDFALRLGFKVESLSTNTSSENWKSWSLNGCQPNFWRNVDPDPSRQCGPYVPKNHVELNHSLRKIDSHNHDTIGMVAIDHKGKIAAGTSTNGAKFKIPGRVGDSPIPGAGAYADQEVGGAAATGDGDIMMRFLPSFLAVEEMRRGASPKEAAQTAINRIVRKYPKFSGAIVVLRIDGTYSAACHNLPDSKFPFSVANNALSEATVEFVDCVDK